MRDNIITIEPIGATDRDFAVDQAINLAEEYDCRVILVFNDHPMLIKPQVTREQVYERSEEPIGGWA